jgi:hypothetical protein
MDSLDGLQPLEREEVIRAFAQVDECLRGSIKVGGETAGEVVGGEVGGEDAEWNEGGVDAT